VERSDTRILTGFAKSSTILHASKGTKPG